MTQLRRVLAASTLAIVCGCAASVAPPLTQPSEVVMQRAAVRYQVTDVSRSIAFYTERFGFEVETRAGDAFAAVTLGSLRLLLSGPGSSGSRPMPDGRAQAPGGWTRILIDVDDLDA